jgi:hypothetical protein
MMDDRIDGKHVIRLRHPWSVSRHSGSIVFARKFHTPTNTSGQAIQLAVSLFPFAGRMEVYLNEQIVFQTQSDVGAANQPFLISIDPYLMTHNSLQICIQTQEALPDTVPVFGEDFVRSVELHIADMT